MLTSVAFDDVVVVRRLWAHRISFWFAHVFVFEETQQRILTVFLILFAVSHERNQLFIASDRFKAMRQRTASDRFKAMRQWTASPAHTHSRQPKAVSLIYRFEVKLITKRRSSSLFLFWTDRSRE